MKQSCPTVALLVALHAGLLLMAAGVAVSSLSGSRGVVELTPASHPTRITDDGAVELDVALSLAEISEAEASCTVIAGADTLPVAPNRPAVAGGVRIFITDCSPRGVGLLCVDDPVGRLLSTIGCVLMIAASLLLLGGLAGRCVRSVRRPWQWAVLVLLAGGTTVLFLPADPSLPVLRTPWLVIHIVPLIAAYALMPVGLWMVVFRRGLLPMLMRCISLLLTLGIALGAVWASLSWGRFWGWDLKETWALAAWAAATLPLHFRCIVSSGRRMAAAMLLLCLLTAATFLALNPFSLPSLHTY